MSVSLDKLSAAQRALLAKRLQMARRKGKKAVTIYRRPQSQAPTLLSFAQQRLWFLNQWESDSPVYNIPLALHLVGHLDIDALRKAFDKIVRRHEVLRTLYVNVKGVPIQQLSDSQLALDVIDLSDLPVAERVAKARHLADEKARRPFRLDCELPLRVSLFRLSHTEHVVLLTLHHIAADGWSLGLLLKELETLYADFHAGRPASLSELPIQYADFAYWQRNWLQGETLEKQLTYWKKQLAGAPTVLDLPSDRPRPPTRTYNGAVYDFCLPSSLAQAVRELSTQEGVSPFVILLAAFQALLWRYTGQSDIVVGAPIAGRNRSEIEDLIGCFVNTLVLRANFSGNPTMRELLRQVREVTLGAYAHQDLPFEKLVEALQPERQLNYSPLFQVMFNFHNAPPPTMELPDLRVGYREVHSHTAKFDLSVAVEDSGEEMVCAATYNTDLFDASTISQMMAHFLVMLAGLTDNPDQRLAEVSLLTPVEQQQMVIEWNQTAVAYPPVTCIHQLFEEHAARSPDAIAVAFEEERCTYRVLNQRANKLARHLQSLGVGPDVRVGLFVERSIDIVVGLLGILKAGGAYVPIDPIYPPERVQFMLDDIRTTCEAGPLLLTQARLAADLPNLDDVRVVCLDSDWDQIAQHSAENVPLCVTSANLMYVLFTSGSTGRPKGVAVEHRNYVNYFHGILRQLNVLPGSSFAIVSTFAADLGTTMTFGAMCSGGQLHIIAYQRAADPEALADYFRRNLIDVLKLTPSHFEALQCLSDPADVVPRQRLIFAGEACSWDLIAKVQALDSACTIQNHYGPTETAVAALGYQLVRFLSESAAGAVPLGRPLGNIRVYILDRHLQPVPIGIPGELYIGGKGVARGYFNRPGLTAERFIPDPFSSSEPGVRLYRTGDLTRYRSDGVIEFLGRVDFQVKLRGFRIELGEIEATLAQQPDVREVVVALQGAGEGERLVAYIVPQNEQALIDDALRAFLRKKLPDYMIPALFVKLAALPLTPNGKVNREALPVPGSVRPEIGEPLLAPRDRLEFQLTQIWEEVLGVQPIGVNQNFFELGGHSLLAIRLQTRIQQALDQHLPLTALFQAPTVSDLATLLRHATPAISSSSLVPMQKGEPDKPPLFFVHPGSGSVFCYTHLIRHLGPDQPFYGLQAPGLEGEREPFTQVEAMAEHYISLLRSVQPEGPYLLGGWCRGGVIAFEMAQQLQSQGQEIALLALVNSMRPGVQEDESDQAALLLRFLLAIGLSLESICSESLEPDALVACVYERFKGLDFDTGLAYVMERGKLANILPRDMDLSHVRHRFRVFEGIAQATGCYTPRVYSGAITLFKADRAVMGKVFAGDMGWGALAARGGTVHIIPGNHYTLLREPQVQVLAEQLGHYLHKGE